MSILTLRKSRCGKHVYSTHLSMMTYWASLKNYRATLGLKLNDDFVSLDQCKGVYNAEINPDLLVIVNKVIKKLNDKSYVLYKRDMALSSV